MRHELGSFDVSPRVVRTGIDVEIIIRPRYDHARLGAGGNGPFRAWLYPAGGGPGEMGSPVASEVQPDWVDGGLKARCAFETEGEYVLWLENISGEPKGRSFEFRFYALADDLFSRRPYKGDLHMHSIRSDGRDAPAYVAASCRRIGLDFMALTDHRLYAPSLEAAAAFAGLPIDLQIYPGEEVHPPDNPVHIVNFGGGFSLNEIFRQDESRYRAEVQAIADGLEGFPPGLDRYTYASCEWCFRQIRAGGGLGIFCHPYWFTRHRYDITEAIVTQVLDRQPFDAMEVVGGYHRHELESNVLQVSRYHEERAKGRRFGAVGVSDSHGCESGELFGWYFTVVFAPSCSLPHLVGSIRDLYSVAVEALPGELARAHGPWRLARYTQFLLREVFPQHDELCQEEGRLMLAAIAGDPQAPVLLGALQGRTKALYDHLWGKSI